MNVLLKSVVVVFVVGGVVMGLSYGWQQGLTRVQHIRITNSDDSGPESVFRQTHTSLKAELSELKGRHIWNIELKDVLSTIKKDRRVQRAQVRRVFPDKVEVSIVPHRPLLGLLTSSGRLVPVAVDATLMPSLPMDDLPDVPVLRGAVFENKTSLRRRAVDLVQKLPHEGVFSRASLSEIKYSEKEGFVFVLMDSGLHVKIGEKGISEKVSKIERVIEYLNKKGIEGRVIDARFSKKVVVKLRNEP